MEKYLYFADGNGANLTTEAYTAPASAIAGVVPELTTTTVVYFNKSVGVDNLESKDAITFTHDNTTNTTGHRVKDIARAIAEAANAGPHVNGVVDVVDLDNSIFYGNLSFVTGISVAFNVLASS
jgi:hypothetical protein|tara:strand:+ start:873 stop:1244 length:372 start_codon:yes stop_codon:yes gene_type:complete